MRTSRNATLCALALSASEKIEAYKYYFLKTNGTAQLAFKEYFEYQGN